MGPLTAITPLMLIRDSGVVATAAPSEGCVVAAAHS